MFFNRCKIFHGIATLYLFNCLPTGKYLPFLTFPIINNLAFNISEYILLHLRDTGSANTGMLS